MKATAFTTHVDPISAPPLFAVSKADWLAKSKPLCSQNNRSVYTLSSFDVTVSAVITAETGGAAGYRPRVRIAYSAARLSS